MKLSHLIHKAISVRMLLVILTILFAFCVGLANSASEPGTVTIVVATEPENLDPSETARDVCTVILENVVETLTEVNPNDSSITPRLATSWKQIDPNTWHFFLRKGVKFHDGADFNAEAVLFNIKRLYDKRIVSKIRDKFFSGFTMEGKALDSQTLEIKVDKFQPLMLTLMGRLTICSPNTPLDKLIRNPIGTGPYKLARWDAGTQIILERFDGYWGKQPQVKKGIYLWRKESSIRASMVLIGEADLAQEIAKQDVNQPEMDKSFLNGETTMFRVGGEWEPPLNDRRVRMALNYAVDRDAIRGTILSKDVVPATQLVVPSIFGYNPDLKLWPYDPKKARQLLDEARKEGVPVDKEILMMGRMRSYPGSEELAEFITAMYKAVGFNVKLKMSETGVWRRYDVKPFPTNAGPYLQQKTHDNTSGDAVFTLAFSYHCKGRGSSTCDRTLDDLIEKGEVATGEQRRNLWKAAFKRIYEEIIPNVFLFHMVGYARIGKRINYVPSLATNTEIQLAQITFK